MIFAYVLINSTVLKYVTLMSCIDYKRLFSFAEWVEFSPYEIGMVKYGTFMKTEHFGSKFFCGKLLNRYDEPSLHYMQGK